MYQRFIKRFLDFILSLIAIIILSPVILVVAILVRIKLGSPIVFAQERTGYHNRLFTMYKFRSMTDERGENGELLPDEERLTKFGQLLRASSLDELPGLFNILKGEMSIVGPRPLLPDYVDLYSPRQSRRHDVLPGLTGLAQVNGRNVISWEEKFEFDLEYANEVSFLLDVKIVFLTIKKVLVRADINAEDAATVEAFHGTRKKRFGAGTNRTLRILFAGAGRNVELIQTFLYAAGNMGISIDTYGADESIALPAMLTCRHQRKTLPAKNPAYPEQILDICRRDRIDMVIPLTQECVCLSTVAARFEKLSCQLLLGPEEMVRMCMDKQRVIEFFDTCGVHTTKGVRDIAEYHGRFPVAIELYDTVRGIYSYKVDRIEELQYYAGRFPEYLIRPFVEGTAYEVDVCCDFQGNPIYITPRIREAARGEELARFRVVQDEMMVLETKAIVEKLKPVGPITVSIIREDKSELNYFVGIRPLFSENVPISIKAGADAPLALLNLMYDIPQKWHDKAAQDGVLFGRFAASVPIQDDKTLIRQIHDLRELVKMPAEVEAVLFDLDDTLYSEKEYFRSGYREVAKLLPEVPNAYNKLCAELEKGELPIETLLMEENLYSDERIAACMKAYRDQDPEIALYPEVPDILRELHKQRKLIGIISDGNPVNQRKKIKKLGLEDMVDEIILTGELAGNADDTKFSRPNDISFLIMRRRLDIPLRNMAFVGDNKEIDFVAPLKLGMECYYYMNRDGLHGE